MKTFLAELEKNYRVYTEALDRTILENEDILAPTANPGFEPLLVVCDEVASIVDELLKSLNERITTYFETHKSDSSESSSAYAVSKLNDLTTAHSHRLRAPIARIQGLHTLYEADPEATNSPDIQNELQSELNRSLLELRDEFGKIEKTFFSLKQSHSDEESLFG